LCQYSAALEVELMTTAPVAAVVSCFVAVASAGERPAPLVQGTKSVLLKEGAVNELSHTSTSAPRVPHTQILFSSGLSRVIGLVTFCETVETGNADQVPPELRRRSRFNGSLGLASGASLRPDLIET
jgi:hypothetical protein